VKITVKNGEDYFDGTSEKECLGLCFHDNTKKDPMQEVMIFLNTSELQGILLYLRCHLQSSRTATKTVYTLSKIP